MISRRALIMLMASSLFATLSMANTTAQTIEGVWLSGDGSGWIRIEISGGSPVGIIAGSPDDPDQKLPPRHDDLNPDPTLRNRPLFGLTIMQGFKPDGNGKWKNGRIYDPNSGKTYKCKLNLVDANTLEVRGYIGFALMGRTEVWIRDKT